MTDHVFVCQMFIQVQIVEMQYVEENIIYGSKMNPALLEDMLDSIQKEVIV